MALSQRYTFGGYPADCPPVTSELEGTYYRIAHRPGRVTRKDFRSYKDRNMHEDMEETDPCHRRSVSIHADISDCKWLMELYPQIGRAIAKIQLPGGHGIVEYTPSKENGQSHHDWWIPEGIDPCSFFVAPEDASEMNA